MAIFGEVLTAMVTPFKDDLTIDFEGVKRLARYLVENGSDGLVVCGTTGESPTLSKAEKLELFRVVKEEVGEEACIIAGTGSNDTKGTIDLTIEAEKIGVDGVMIVAPYYNKPPQEGFYQHFKAVADATNLQLMVYNVPGRTGKNIEPETIARLAKIDNIVAVKEASGDLDQISKIRHLTSPDFAIYSGNDSQTLPILAIGGTGIVSVASHLIGNQIKQMVRQFKAGEVSKAAILHNQLLPIFQGIFVTANPIPIKYLLNQRGIDVGPIRPPLVPATAQEERFLTELMEIIEHLLEA